MEREGDRPEEDQEFLPPEPAGPEPELGDDAPHDAPTEQQTWQQGQQQPPGWQQQAGPQQGWQQQPDPQQGWQPQPGSQQGWQQQPPPPGYGYGYQPPPPGWQQPPPGYGYGPPPYGYYAQRPDEPENGAAVGGFVTSLVAGALLLLTGGLSGPISLIGIVTVVLSVLAIAAWVGLIVVAANDDSFDEEFDNDGGGFDSTRVRAALTAARCAASLLL